MQTINFDIRQLLRKVQAGHFLIPQFQRDFIWKEGQTKLLIDSIARNYPIGSLLVLGKNDEITLQSRKLDATYPPKDHDSEMVDQFDEPGSESYYVLDGQQRLTSIARVFLDANPKRNYYFDLKRLYEEFDNETSSWIISRVRGQKNPDRKDNNKLIRTDISLNQEKCDVYISQYIGNSGDFENSGDVAKFEAAAKLRGVFETIRKFSLPLIVLDNDAPLESICRVFETINSTGTRLTTFDLAVARYFPEPDLKDLFDTSINKHPILKEYGIDGERVLEIMSLYSLRKTNKHPEATRSVLLSLDNKFIPDHWEAAANSLANACDWIQKLGATPKTQPHHTTLVPIAATLMCFPDSLNKSEFSSTLRKWYFCTTLSASPSTANKYKIGDDFRKLCDFRDHGTSIPYPQVYFTKDNLIDIKKTTDSRYKAIQALMRTTVKEDLLTGNSLDDKTEDHHIFPYSLNKSGISKDKLNSIVNRIIVSQETNKDLRNENPDKYLSDRVKHHISEGSTGDLDRRLTNCFIPYRSQDPEFIHKFSQDNFDGFLQDRANMILKRIQEVVGGAWQNLSAAEEKNLEDDEVVIS